ncbi:hypothetical protein KIN20_035122 [Parelaphostrongylus tenuis]|uniref:F-box domain-containing protein n=1 Tax=Parelaphostrongylus tenuis TaxID=148309 RepID=A0AAD5RDN0_PARTN|nr:hypothetical protein KIN20_035122 [Parelaphostrongylus tenuis]
MEQLDTSTLCECRVVCNRWRSIADILLLEARELPTLKLFHGGFLYRFYLKLSCLIIIGLPQGALEFLRVNYDEQRSVRMIVSYMAVRRRMQLSYSFPRLRIDRIFLGNLNLTNSLVNFLCIQLSMCDLSLVTQLSLQAVGFWYVTVHTLHRLFIPVSKYIEVREVSTLVISSTSQQNATSKTA